MCGSNPYEGQEFFLKIHIGSGAHSASFFSIDTVVQGVPCRAEDKNEWSYTSTALCTIMSWAGTPLPFFFNFIFLTGNHQTTSFEADRTTEL